MNDSYLGLITNEQFENNKLIFKRADDIITSYDFENIFMQIMDWKNNNVVEDLPLSEIIVAFCEQKGYDVIDVGEELKKDKQFLTIFKNDLVIHNQFKFEDDVSCETSIGDWM